MARDDDFAPDEWDPPALSRHLPFPPPILLDVDVLDSGPLLFFLLEGWFYYRGWHNTSWWQPWFLWAGVGICAVWTLNALIRPQRRRLLGWVLLIGRHVLLLVVARVIWRPVPVRRVVGQIQRVGGISRRAAQRAQRASRLTPLSKRGWLTILLPKHVGRVLMANVTVDEDGVLDTSGVVGPAWARWLVALARGLEPLVALVWVSDTGNLDLYDPEAREGVWAARQELVARPEHRMSLYLRVRPFPVDEIARAAGPVAAEAAEWAKVLVQRRLLLAVPAARRGILEHRLMGLLGVSDDQPGKLGRAGLYGRRLTEEEVDELGTDAWGAEFKPALAISPGGLEVETGEDDPPPIGEAPDQPRPGNPGVRRHRTYAITGMPDRVAVGWTEPLTGRRVLCDLAIHLTPIQDSWAELVLGVKRAWWGGMTLGREKYTLANAQAARTLNLIRRRQTKALKVGIYATVAETQSPTAELALVEMVGRENYQAPAFDQLAARIATEPTGRDPLGKTFWTDSQTIAAAWPGSGGIWVPGCTLIGESARSNEPVGVNLWWEGDETSVFVICGRSGSGKTNTTQAFIGRMLEPQPDHWLARRPPPAIVAYLKPYDEWAAFCRRFHGRHYRLTTENWRWALGDAPMDTPIVAFNMNDLPDVEQVAFMNELEPWVIAHQEPHHFKHPLIYVVGEAWAWAQDPAQARHLKKLALQVRALGIGLIVDTQFIDHLLDSEARDVVRSASVWMLMRLRTGERRILEEMLDIGPTGMRFLAQIAQPNTLAGGVEVIKGQGIIEAHGLRTTVRVKRFGFEAALLDQTNPRKRDLTDEQDWLGDLDLSLDRPNGRVHAGNGLQLAAERGWKS